MTLILAVIGPETIWMLADRRLSYGGQRPRDDGRKVMFLETTDGRAILGYAGLGATARGTQPADWMSNVLRGRNLSLEQSLGVIAQAIKVHFPRHMGRIPGHTVIVPAFLGKQPRLYTIDIASSPDHKRRFFRYTRHVVDGTQRAPRVAIGGSGTTYLIKNQKTWLRGLLRVVKANEHGQISALAVADHLARLNNEVHLRMKDQSVGPRCVVAWRHMNGGVHNGGGAHKFYNGTTREADSGRLPTIVSGTDMQALASVLMPLMLAGMQKGRPMNEDEIKGGLARLPDSPDEILR